MSVIAKINCGVLIFLKSTLLLLSDEKRGMLYENLYSVGCGR